MRSRSSTGSSSAASVILDTPASLSSLESVEERGSLPSHFAQDTFNTRPESWIMVIGGLGYIGSHTTLELLKSGYNVVVVDNLSNSFQSVLGTIRRLATKHRQAAGLDVPCLNFHKLDYRSQNFNIVLGRYASDTDGEGDRPLSKISGVIHFAAYKSVEESQYRPIDYYMNNVCGLVELIATLGDHGIFNFVYSSSATVYGIKANEGQQLKEQDLVHHPDLEENGEGLVSGIRGLTNPYGRTKYMGEMILADVARANPAWRITALRYFNPVGCDPSGLLGENPRGQPTNLFPIISQVLAEKRERIDVFGSDYDTPDGTAVRDFIHVVDLAGGHLAAIEHANKRPANQAFRTYNLGTGVGFTVSEVISAMEAVSEKKVPQRLVGRRSGDVGYCVAATDRAAEELGWQTKRSLSQCASDLWRYLSVAKGQD